MKTISLNQITDQIKDQFQIIGNSKKKRIKDVRNITSANSDSLVWVNPERKDKQKLVEQTDAELIICDDSISVTKKLQEQKCFIVVPNPKLTFINILNAFFIEEPKFGIHPTAVIHPEANIHKKTFIGPNTYIGKSKISEGTIIYGNNYIYDNVQIGKNVIIHAGCIIGSDGFGFSRDKSGKLHKFPHIGGVIIEDEVELQAMTHVSRGTLEATIIGKGSKFDSCCHIAHNDIIGEDNLVAAHTMFSGSVKIGNQCWIGPSTIFRDVIEIGDGSFVGIGALVLKNLPANSFVMGNPAKPVDEYKSLLKLLKKLLKEEKN